MAVKARFYVRETTRHAGMEVGGSVLLNPSVQGEANKQWSKWTPSGEIRMNTTNPDAMAWFDARLGKDLDITFDDVPAEG